MFCSTSDALQDAALIFANKMRQACVERACPKATTAAWNTHLGKAHPSTFEQAMPKSHTLPIKDNPFLLLARPGATSAWAKRHGHTGWNNNEAHFPPCFQAHLQSIHLIRTGEKPPPKLPCGHRTRKLRLAKP
jgi:hypothetical protein